jgi:hypothetical protein
VTLAVQVATVTFGCIFVYGGCWLVGKVHGLLERADEVYDRADQILGMPALRPETAVMPAVEPERPKPTPGPATVPATEAIDAGYEQITGRHARKEAGI